MIRSLANAWRNLFRPPLPVRYPERDDLPLPGGYRGLILYDVEHCIFCDRCEKACPPKAIVFYQHENGEKEYRYNPWLCIYCGECVRACPKADEALTHSDALPAPALADDRVNDDWFAWQAAARESRERYAAKKKAARAKKAAEKKAESSPGKKPNVPPPSQEKKGETP
jgi:NADH-quinone oxidoreductase subunit I